MLYHGSEKIIKNPSLEFSKPNNDYGKGFYLTKDIELASEWACKSNNDGYINIYDIDIEDLKVLDLTNSKYSVLNWMAILVQNRIFNLDTEILEMSTKYLIKNFNVNYKEYDIVIGYRADDSYFSFATDFLQNIIPLSVLEEAFKFGKLGLQTVLISKKAFSKIKFIEAKSVFSEVYYNKFKDRDVNARLEYKEIRIKTKINKDEIFMSDLLKNQR